VFDLQNTYDLVRDLTRAGLAIAVSLCTTAVFALYPSYIVVFV